MRCLLIGAVLTAAPAWSRAEPTHEEEVSPTVATAITFAGATGGLGLALGALAADDNQTSSALGIAALGVAVVGPSAGRWYARDAAWGGLAMRALGVGLVFAAGAAGDGEAPPGFVFAPGIALFGAGLVWDLYQTPRAVERRNRTRTVVSPLVTSRTTGLALSMTF